MKDLVKEYLRIKNEENLLKEKRNEIESMIYSLAEESGSMKISNEHFKLSIKPNFSVKVDQEFAAIHSNLFKTKYEMTYSQYEKSLNKNTVEKGIIITPIKPTFTIELV